MQGRARIAGEEVLHEITRRWSYRTLPRVDALGTGRYYAPVDMKGMPG